MCKNKAEDLSWICYREESGWREHVFPADAKFGSKCWCGAKVYRFHVKQQKHAFYPETEFLSDFDARSYSDRSPKEGTLDEVLWFLFG